VIWHAAALNLTVWWGNARIEMRIWEKCGEFHSNGLSAAMRCRKLVLPSLKFCSLVSFGGEWTGRDEQAMQTPRRKDRPELT
jgi:hypothetical protein